MAWVYLFAAGLFEIIWAFALKRSHGFTLIGPSVITVAGMIVSIFLLSMAMRTLPLGSAYAIWTGIGAVGAIAIGIIVLGEPLTPLRVTAGGLILAGIVTMVYAGNG